MTNAGYENISPRLYHPHTAAEAWELRRTFGGDAVFVAGGTLLRTHWEAGTAVVSHRLIDLRRIPGITGISATEEGLLLGAMTPLSACRSSGDIRSGFPLLTEAVRSIAAPSVRNLATIGGNVASRIGDTLPALLVCDAVLHWQDGAEEQRERLADWLAEPSPRQDRILLRIELPFDPARTTNSKASRFGAFHKVGRREAFTPSVVTAAVTGGIHEASGEWQDVRIALGGGQTVPVRQDEAEVYLQGRKASDVSALQAVYEMVKNGFEPRGDAFASAGYRKTTAANIVASELWLAGRGAP